jgi:hypothetical protein
MEEQFMEEIVSLTPEETALILSDFASVYAEREKIRDLEDSLKDEPDARILLAGARVELGSVSDKEIVWWDGREGYEMKKIANPRQYVDMRDDFAKTKEFIASSLDKGRLYYGTSYWNQDGETNPAEYISWMYRYCGHAGFKMNVEQAVIDLLEEELGRQFDQYDLEKGMELALEERAKYAYVQAGADDMFENEDLRGAVLRSQLDHNVPERELAFRDYFVAELGETERPITREEFVEGFAGPKEELEKSYDTGKPAKQYKRIHPKETSPEFKKAYEEFMLERQARAKAVESFQPQFDRLVGLLDIVMHVGTKDNGFVKSRDVLEEKAREGFMADAPNFSYHFTGANVYNSLLLALSAVGDTSLHDFWLERIEKDPIAQIPARIHAYFSQYASKKERKAHIPDVIARLQKRIPELDTSVRVSKGIFIDDENILENIVSQMTYHCYPRTFSFFDKKRGTFDVLLRKEISPQGYDFTLCRHTSEGKRTIRARYDLATKSIDAAESVSSTIKAYLDNGYPIPNGLTITSLQVREIQGMTKYVSAEDKGWHDGMYEGIIGMNHSMFPFIYDPIGKNVLLAPPLETACLFFGKKDAFKTRRLREKLKEKIPSEQFVPLEELSEKVDGLIAEKKKQGFLGDSLYALQGRLDDSLSEYIVSVIDSRRRI